MIKKVFSALFLLVFVLLIYPSTVSAQQCPTSRRNKKGQCLDTCESKGYCENNAWIEKSGCNIDYEEFPECKRVGECERTEPICICNYVQAKKDCGTQGGINRSQSNVDSVIGGIKAPDEISKIGVGEKGINNILQLVIQLIYIASGVAFVVLFLWSAFQLIISGGSKEGIAAARQHITWSIIGLAMLALAFPFFRLLEGILGFKFFG